MTLLPSHTRGVLVELYRPHFRALSLAFVLLCLASLVTLVVPWLIGRFAEVLLDVDDPWRAAELLAMVVLCVLAQAVISYLAAVRVGSIAQRLILELRGTLYAHMQGLPLVSVQRFSSGALLNLFAHDAVVVTEFLFGVTLTLLPQALLFVGAAVLVARIDPVIAVAAALGIPLIAAAAGLTTRRIRVDSGEMYERLGESMGRVEEGIHQLPRIKAAVQAEAEADAYRSLNAEVERLFRLVLERQALLTPLTRFVGVCAVLVMVWLLAARTANPLEDIEELVGLILYGLLMIRPAAAMLQQYGQWQATAPALERLEALLSQPVENTTVGVELDLRQPVRICCDGLTFAYDERAAPVLEDLSFDFAGPGILLVRGPNGAGKSTLLKLFNRLLEPDAGVLELQGRSVTDVRLNDLRCQVGWLPQDAELLNRSIRDNLAFGHGARAALTEADAGEGAPAEAGSGREVVGAAVGDELQALLDFLDPQRLDEAPGERGAQLSGGQRQRLLLCQVLSAAQPLILLDEPTLSLDAAGERKFLELLREFARSHTLVIATHDEALIEVADQVIELA